MTASVVAGPAMLLLVVPFGWGLSGVWLGLVVLMVVWALTLAWRH
ncbi:MAG: hypothetical protein U5L04_17125 [Trueperaceae bacterium]|nr:hypothetical protein [Trueperaceae bacterium]